MNYVKIVFKITTKDIVRIVYGLCQSSPQIN